jgi:hypothetical protein
MTMPLSAAQMEILSKLSKEELLEFIDLQQRNWWNLQNNWMAYMNAQYGMEAAVKGDAHCFTANARVQVHRLKKMFGLGDGVEALRKAMVLSTIWANGESETRTEGDTRCRVRVTRCDQQLRRLEEGLGELACKPAAMAICEAAAAVINPACQVRCIVCPPDAHPADLWCEWEFEVPARGRGAPVPTA